MTRYLLTRLGYSFVVIVVVLVLVFIVTHLLGDPVRIALPLTATQAQVDAIRERLHLNDPFLVQLKDFVVNALSGSFGDSFWQRKPAMDLVLERLPATIYLAVAGFVLIVPLGITMGILAAVRPRSLLEQVINVLSFIGISIVDFWLALMLILIFAVALDVVPTSGYGGIEYVILPAVTLALIGSGMLAQVTRTSVSEELTKSYVAAARARGVSETRVVLRHALRNALIPIVTLGGGLLIGLLNGAIVIEVVFGWPGIGRLLVQAIGQRDLPLIEATVFFSAVVVTGLNLVVDVLYSVLNPRVRLT